MPSRDAEFGSPRPHAHYPIGFDLASGHIVRLADTDSLAWGQICLIQAVAATRDVGGGGVLVLLHVPSGEVRERVTVLPGGPPDD